MPAVLGYWKIRGLGQPIRLLLEYCGEKFEDKKYEQGSAPNYSRDEWLSVKSNLGLPFPNLPYYIDGDFKLCQSNAIMRYIAEKHNMAGKTTEERAQVAMIENEIMDLRMAFARTCYNSAFITFPDFHVYDVLDSLKALEPTCLNDFKNLQDYTARFEALPAIETYMKSDRFLKFPFNNKIAQWGAEK